MKYTFTLITFLVAQMTIAQGASLENLVTSEVSTTEIDGIFNRAYPTNSPGAAVLIARGDSVLYRKAFGLANLELNVPMKPENVFQLASITKQFTSVAILILMEQGKLSIQDPLSKYIADYPRGTEITLHHLLNHTSGIKDYTRIPELRNRTRLDMTPEELINTFKNLPLEFEPNEKYDYSNSGYVLLGYIIEQLSGMSYGEFIKANIFDKLGMNNSYYADNYRVVANKAYGYQLYGGRYENAEYMSPTFPYAAGSLMSTVDDMFLWNKAIHNNTLISEESKRRAFKNYTLANGKPDNYGYGWFINEIAGITTLEHQGGINGFTTSGIYLPGENIFSIVLTNLDDGIGAERNNIKAVSALLGKSSAENAVEEVSEKELKKWVGAYQFEDVLRFISFENGALYSRREGGHPLKLLPVSDSEFRFENSLAVYKFSSKKGKKQVLFTDRIVKSVGVETDKKPMSEKEAIPLEQEMLVKYVGVYELQPSFQIEVEIQNGRLLANATNQPPVELLADGENSFFIKEIEAVIVFNLNPDGTVMSLTFSQDTNKTEGKKIK